MHFLHGRPKSIAWFEMRIMRKSNQILDTDSFCHILRVNSAYQIRVTDNTNQPLILVYEAQMFTWRASQGYKTISYTFGWFNAGNPRQTSL